MDNSPNWWSCPICNPVYFALYCSDAKQWTVIKVHTGNSPMSTLVPMQLQGFDLTGSQAQAL